MDYQKRKMIDGIREGLVLRTEMRIKEMGNPYASLNIEYDHKQLNKDAKVIYKHLKNMGLIK